MKIRVTQASPSPSGLRLGLTVEGPKKAWLRFSTTVLVVDELDQETRRWLVRELNRGPSLPGIDPAQEPLFD